MLQSSADGFEQVHIQHACLKLAHLCDNCEQNACMWALMSKAEHLLLQVGRPVCHLQHDEITDDE